MGVIWGEAMSVDAHEEGLAEAEAAQTTEAGSGARMDRLDRIGFAPIVRVDASRREIEL